MQVENLVKFTEALKILAKENGYEIKSVDDDVYLYDEKTGGLGSWFALYIREVPSV